MVGLHGALPAADDNVRTHLALTLSTCSCPCCGHTGSGTIIFLALLCCGLLSPGRLGPAPPCLALPWRDLTFSMLPAVTSALVYAGPVNFHVWWGYMVPYLLLTEMLMGSPPALPCPDLTCGLVCYLHLSMQGRARCLCGGVTQCLTCC
jgi:hypothetical protein